MIGFDNIHLTSIIKPKLTMITQPMEDLAREAARLLTARIEGTMESEEFQTIRMLPQLVAGESIRRL